MSDSKVLNTCCWRCARSPSGTWHCSLMGSLHPPRGAARLALGCFDSAPPHPGAATFPPVEPRSRPSAPFCSVHAKPPRAGRTSGHLLAAPLPSHELDSESGWVHLCPAGCTHSPRQRPGLLRKPTSLLAQNYSREPLLKPTIKRHLLNSFSEVKTSVMRSC